MSKKRKPYQNRIDDLFYYLVKKHKKLGICRICKQKHSKILKDLPATHCDDFAHPECLHDLRRNVDSQSMGYINLK